MQIKTVNEFLRWAINKTNRRSERNERINGNGKNDNRISLFLIINSHLLFTEPEKRAGRTRRSALEREKSGNSTETFPRRVFPILFSQRRSLGSQPGENKLVAHVKNQTLQILNAILSIRFVEFLHIVTLLRY